MSDPRLLDEIGINATASTIVQLVDGWMLRASPGFPFHRNNCAIAFDDARIDALPVIEEFFARHQQPVIIQVRDDMADVDGTLAAHGYALDSATDILVAPTEVVVERACTDRVVVQLHDDLDDASIEAYGDVMGETPYMVDRIKAYGRMMRVLGPITFSATAPAGASEPTGIGFGVVERGWIGYYGIGTATTARRTGIATAIMRALTQRAMEHGATDAYLQVAHDNEGALTLYDRLGFTRAYGYHYRTRP